MEPLSFLNIFAAIAAVVSAAMWIDYFRRIDVFEPERIGPLLLTLFIGGCTPFLSLEIYGWIADAGFAENGEFWNDLFYSIFCIGLNEEFSKLLGVLLVFIVLHKSINEPVDYLIYAGIAALGFSLFENYYYFLKHGVKIITSRTFYSALEHIINTSIIVYGIYRYQLFGKGHPIVNSLVAISLAVASHGLFDFFLTITDYAVFTALFSMLIYMVGINFWVQMLNNANNYSSYFDYNKSPASTRLAARLLAWFLLTLILAFAGNVVAAGFSLAGMALLSSVASDGLLFLLVIIRVSRFKILKGAYQTILPQLPLYLTKNKDEDIRIPLLNLKIRVRGENFREHLLTRAVQKMIRLIPAKNHNTETGEYVVKIIRKLLLADDVAVYQIDLQLGNELEKVVYFLRPKSGPLAIGDEEQLLVGLYQLNLSENYLDLDAVKTSGLNFLGWYKFKPITG
jgi:RsiW-degrading membrane proteinase PrsW (M82 family)